LEGLGILGFVWGIEGIVDPKNSLVLRQFYEFFTDAAFLGLPQAVNVMKKKSYSFSIYLLKQGFDEENSLDEDHDLEPASARNLPPNSRLFLLDGESELWWPVYLGIEKAVRRNRVGAVLFVRSSGRVFALTFGQVGHLLCDESFEHEFGLIVTLNSLDPNKLKSTDTISPGPGKWRRTQLPIETDLTVLDFDQNGDVLKSLTGRVRDEFKTIFSSISGSDSVKVRSDFPAPQLGKLCEALFNLFQRTDYKQNFPEIGKIARISDPTITDKLDERLLVAVQSRSPWLNLTIPALLEIPNGHIARFAGAGRGTPFTDVYIEPYFEYLDASPNSVVAIDTLKRSHKLILKGEFTDGKKTFSVYRCLVFDTALDDGCLYHLLDGHWYRVDRDFVDELQSSLDGLWRQSSLPDFSQRSEGLYNVHVGVSDPKFVCLDTSSISPIKKHRIEPCDLLSVFRTRLRLWHVKRSTLSFSLSHLFNQGANSLHILKREPRAVENLRKLIEKHAEGALRERLIWALDGGLFEVNFAIVTHKDANAKAANLPLFSKITLRRTAKELLAYGVRTRFEFIRDVSEKKKRNAKVIKPTRSRPA